jgi:hypothetical protein
MIGKSPAVIHNTREQTRIALPQLEVGWVYRIDRMYEGKVVGFFGGKWHMQTNTGIRTFTQSQLVGTKIEVLEMGEEFL